MQIVSLSYMKMQYAIMTKILKWVILKLWVDICTVHIRANICATGAALHRKIIRILFNNLQGMDIGILIERLKGPTLVAELIHSTLPIYSHKLHNQALTIEDLKVV